MGKSEDTKRKLMETAAEIFARKGYAASTTREIAESAGVSEAALFKYYKSKKGLLHETLLNFIEETTLAPAFEGIDQIVENNRDLTTEALFRALFLDRVHMIEKNFQMFKILIMELQYHADVREIFMEKAMGRIVHYANRLSGILRERDDIRKDLDTMTIIRSFMGIVLLTILQKKMLPELVVSNESVEVEIERMVDLFMKGIRKGEEA